MLIKLVGWYLTFKHYSPNNNNISLTLILEILPVLCIQLLMKPLDTLNISVCISLDILHYFTKIILATNYIWNELLYNNSNVS